MQPQMIVGDRFFYDQVAGRYTVDRYLDDMQRRMGGIAFHKRGVRVLFPMMPWDQGTHRFSPSPTRRFPLLSRNLDQLRSEPVIIGAQSHQ
jgi:hypothetical protein